MEESIESVGIINLTSNYSGAGNVEKTRLQTDVEIYNSDCVTG